MPPPEQKGRRNGAPIRTGAQSSGRCRAACDRCHAPAVLRPAIFGGFGADWALLAIRDCIDAGRRHPETDEIFLHRVCTTGTECEIVFAGTALIAMTFDR